MARASIPKRLAKSKARLFSPLLGLVHPSPKQALRLLTQAGPERDWKNEPQLRQAIANKVLTLDDPLMGKVFNDDLVRKAFKEFPDLDPNDPSDWRRLLDTLAAVVFSTGRPRGSEKWTSYELRRLATRHRMLKAEHSKWTDTEICDELKRRYPNEYRGIEVSTIRRRLQDAKASKPRKTSLSE